jgi:hypothetical protein
MFCNPLTLSLPLVGGTPTTKVTCVEIDKKVRFAET